MLIITGSMRSRIVDLNSDERKKLRQIWVVHHLRPSKFYIIIIHDYIHLYPPHEKNKKNTVNTITRAPDWMAIQRRLHDMC